MAGVYDILGRRIYSKNRNGVYFVVGKDGSIKREVRIR
jgi:hypothetical protein